MPDLKISQLTGGGAAQAADEFPNARSGANYKITGENIAAAATSVGTLTSLTVSGNVTVDTNTLFVDATNNRVGIGTASPGVNLEITANAPILRIRANSAGTAELSLFSAGSADGRLRYGGSSTGFTFLIDTTERMRLDHSGNLGLGVTPSAWTSAFGPVVQIKTGSGGGALTGSSTDNFRMFANTFYDGAYKRIAAGFATQYEQASGTHVWYTAGTSTANSAITFTQAMTLDVSNCLLVDTTTRGVGGSSVTKLTVGGNSATTYSSVKSSGGEELLFGTTAGATFIGAWSNNFLELRTNNTERARITAAGDVGIGTTSPGQKLEVAGRQRFSGSSVGIAIENRMTDVSVTTSAVTILDSAGAYGRLVVVNGGSGTDRFCDLVLASTTVSPTVVSSYTAGGTPAARTYTRSGSALQLAMASGTYSVWTLALGY